MVNYLSIWFCPSSNMNIIALYCVPALSSASRLTQKLRFFNLHEITNLSNTLCLLAQDLHLISLSPQKYKLIDSKPSSPKLFIELQHSQINSTTTNSRRITLQHLYLASFKSTLPPPASTQDRRDGGWEGLEKADKGISCLANPINTGLSN